MACQTLGTCSMSMPSVVWPRFSPERDSQYSFASSATSSMHYTYTFAASSPNVSPSASPQSSQNVRIPRYLRRYTICAPAQHRPTSPLAYSFTPDEYAANEATSSSVHQTTWHRSRSESFIVNPGPKVHQCKYTTSPSPSSPTAILSRAHSLIAHVSPSIQQLQPTNELRRRTSNTSIHSQSSQSSFSSDCSFHTAADDVGYVSDDNKTLLPLSSQESPVEEPKWVEHPPSIKHDWSNSSNSSSAFGFASTRGQSSADTVVSPVDECHGITVDKAMNGDEWPVTYLTTITRQELDEFEKENRPQERRRKFSWFRTDKTPKEASPPVQTERSMDGARRKSQKLKKRRPVEFMHPGDEGIHSPEPTLDVDIIPIYTEVEQEDFDPLKDFFTQEEPVVEVVQPDETMDEAQIGIAISSDDMIEGEEHPFETAIEAILNGQDEEWEDMDSDDHPGFEHGQGQISWEDGQDMWLDDAILERLHSRTPQEILQGLDVVHEEEEEDFSLEAKDGNDDDIKEVSGGLEKQESYPYIKDKGKERQDEGTTKETREGDLEQPVSEGIDAVAETPIEDMSQPASEKSTPSSPQRRKLSKRRPSRRLLDADAPPIPQRKSKSKFKTSGEKREGMRRRSALSSKKPSVVTLRPRRTPQTVLSSFRSHVFRPFSSFALLLGINVANGKRRLSRDLRTPNALLAGRHFSEKHIPRFPSRLDGFRTVDKKAAKYE